MTVANTRTETLHGHDLWLVDSGEGPAVLFIHGLLGSHRTWMHLVDKIDDNHGFSRAQEPWRESVKENGRRDVVRHVADERERAARQRRLAGRDFGEGRSDLEATAKLVLRNVGTVRLGPGVAEDCAADLAERGSTRRGGSSITRFTTGQVELLGSRQVG